LFLLLNINPIDKLLCILQERTSNNEYNCLPTPPCSPDSQGLLLHKANHNYELPTQVNYDPLEHPLDLRTIPQPDSSLIIHHNAMNFDSILRKINTDLYSNLKEPFYLRGNDPKRKLEGNFSWVGVGRPVQVTEIDPNTGELRRLQVRVYDAVLKHIKVDKYGREIPTEQLAKMDHKKVDWFRNKTVRYCAGDYLYIWDKKENGEHTVGYTHLQIQIVLKLISNS